MQRLNFQDLEGKQVAQLSLREGKLKLLRCEDPQFQILFEELQGLTLSRRSRRAEPGGDWSWVRQELPPGDPEHWVALVEALHKEGYQGEMV